MSTTSFLHRHYRYFSRSVWHYLCLLTLTGVGTAYMFCVKVCVHTHAHVIKISSCSDSICDPLYPALMMERSGKHLLRARHSCTRMYTYTHQTHYTSMNLLTHIRTKAYVYIQWLIHRINVCGTGLGPLDASPHERAPPRGATRAAGLVANKHQRKTKHVQFAVLFPNHR